jgi:hypothetical protein
MKILAITLAAAGLLASGSASAGERMTDVAFLKAARCNGLAKAVPGVVDEQALDALYKGAASGRQPFVADRADQAFADGKREGRTASKEKTTAELTGACAALLSNPSSVAKQ